MLGHHARRAALVFVAAICGTATTFVAAAPAAAALPSGEGYSASWDYYTSTSYRYTATLPGIRLTGYGTDNNGTRTTLGTITDAKPDSRCGRVVLFGGSTMLADKLVCGNGTSVSYSTGSFTGAITVVFQRRIHNTTTVDHSYTFVIPSTAGDPTLRTIGSGAKWFYEDDHTFQFTLKRPTLTMTGRGSHQPWQNQRSVLADLVSADNRCTRGWADSDDLETEIRSCGGDPAYISDWFHSGWIRLEACDTGTHVGDTWPPNLKCVGIQVPIPR